MRIGYACSNLTLGTRSRTFRLASYRPERLEEAVLGNVADALAMIEFGREHGLCLLRLTAGFVPFASHSVMDFDWQGRFEPEFREIGRKAREADIRLSIHPGQFVLINSNRPEVVEASVKELVYQAELLELMEAGPEVRLQIHVGGVYGDRDESMRRWEQEWRKLPVLVQKRLMIENDERLFPLADCVRLHEATGVPVLFDVFHHSFLNEGESTRDATTKAARTWDHVPGAPQMDFSNQDPDKRPGAHAVTIEDDAFRQFLSEMTLEDVDVMIEIKDKETSALRARKIAEELGRIPVRELAAA